MNSPNQLLSDILHEIEVTTNKNYGDYKHQQQLAAVLYRNSLLKIAAMINQYSQKDGAVECR